LAALRTFASLRETNATTYFCLMNTDILIIGQGISGTFLSYYLQKANKDFLVIDNNDIRSSSRLAAGVINPVTGRRLVTVWMADEILPNAWNAYQAIGKDLEITAIFQRSIIDFFPNPFMREGFLQKIESGDIYVHAFPEQNHFNHFFRYEFGCGEIRPAYTVNLEALLPAWRRRMIEAKVLIEENFDIGDLHIEPQKIRYRNITANKIIFCDGAPGAENPFFGQLPFAPNKGEALVVHVPGLEDQYVYKKSMMMVPMLEKDHFWIGASYLWDFKDASPSAEFLDNTTRLLKEWLRLPFTIVEHRAGLRPATLERRPFVGLHPKHPEIGILNGMGTKGYSLAPYFANELVNHIYSGAAIVKEADVKRFSRILSR
jgi:glycine/D-amino acid oxidase-like deaminating enzyme